VLSREASGYHQLETLFQRIAHADTVTVRTGISGRSLECAGAETGPVDRNLAWRAALAFSDATGWPSGFGIEIVKRIPVGGGLGGGSADAGAVLRILAELSPRPLTGAQRIDLAARAAQLGADVPFLAGELPLAIGLGRGERLLPLPPLPGRAVVLCVPPFGVSSADAFAWYAETSRSTSPAAHDPLPTLGPVSWETVAEIARNDLEPPVFARHRELAIVRDALAAMGATFARMTGSGSTLVGIFSASHAPGTPDVPPGWRVLSSRTVDRVAAVEPL
jgi:4-diphosphocytidyl-2-C-methyl-D-erythritol kinase